MKLLKTLLYLLTLVPFTNAEAQSGFFIPNTLITPDHTAANDLHISLGWTRGIDLHTSYAITDKIAIFGTALVNKGNFTYTTLFVGRRNVNKNDHAFSSGASYYINKEKNVRMQVIIGLAKFKTANKKNVDFLTETSYLSAFSQFNYTKDKLKSQTGFGARLSYNRYAMFNFYDRQGSHRYENPWSLNIEPVVNLNFKIKTLKIGLQGGVSLPVLTDYVKEYYQMFGTGEEILLTHVKTKEAFGNFIGRVSLQHNFNLKKKN